ATAKAKAKASTATAAAAFTADFRTGQADGAVVFTAAAATRPARRRSGGGRCLAARTDPHRHVLQVRQHAVAGQVGVERFDEASVQRHQVPLEGAEQQ